MAKYTVVPSPGVLIRPLLLGWLGCGQKERTAVTKSDLFISKNRSFCAWHADLGLSDKFKTENNPGLAKY